MAYTHKNHKGQAYYLHKKGVLYYFSRSINQNRAVKALPEGRHVKENPKTGLPYLAR